ncbi:zinc finger protein 566-like [Ambystoma mexicanum]|uniref:zinc finger protein 566-like n=1 Tax=Ambystoma mexicanum TaxID=8296 RepID=UPI0037E85CA8
MGKQRLHVEKTESGDPLKCIHLRHPNRVFPRVPKGYAVARLVMIRPDPPVTPSHRARGARPSVQKPEASRASEPESAKPVDLREQEGQLSALRGSWTVRLLRLDPAVVAAHHIKATEPPEEPRVSTLEIKSRKKRRVRARKGRTDRKRQRDTLPAELRKDAPEHNGDDEEDISKTLSQSQNGASMPVVNTPDISKTLSQSQNGALMPVVNTPDQSCSSESAITPDHPMPQAKEKLHTCSECGEGFQTLPKLLIHQKIHMGKQQLTCSECGKSFIFHSLLVMHKRIHTEVWREAHSEREKPYACTACGNRFSDPATLIKHHKIHAKLKPYACSECDKTFCAPQNLNNHMRQHAREKPYTCPECSKGFSSSTTLQKHQEIHAGVRSVPQPEVTAPDSVKPYTCLKCGARFSASVGLMKHQQTHMGVKPHKCDECGKSFNYSLRLKIHQRVHAGQRDMPKIES